MIESIYVSAQQLEGVAESGANHLMVSNWSVNEESWKNLQGLGMELSIAVDSFESGYCPADPKSIRYLMGQLTGAMKYQPKEIWLDGFRFGGHCTFTEDSMADQTHSECRYCAGLDRVEIINYLAKHVARCINGQSRLGIFAVAFKDEEAPKLAQSLGLDYEALGRVADCFSPMLYHQMLGKPIEYISEYTAWLAEKTGKPVLPIVQVKTMPDELDDTTTPEILKAEVEEAVKPPSEGVSLFWWQHVLEKNKTEIVKDLFARI